jgi:AcrR family transcriptional regulator
MLNMKPTVPDPDGSGPPSRTLAPVASGDDAPMDRRVRKSRAALTGALRDLLNEGRDYEDISVEDIARRADVARATFYAHWADKDSLYLVLVEELLADLGERLRRMDTEGRALAFDGSRQYVAMRHAKENRFLYLPIFRATAGGRVTRHYMARLRIVMRDTLDRIVARAGSTPTVPLDIEAQTMAGSHLALLSYWLDDPEGQLYSAEEMARFRVQQHVYGVSGSLGLAPGSIPVNDEGIPEAWELSEPA